MWFLDDIIQADEHFDSKTAVTFRCPVWTAKLPLSLNERYVLPLVLHLSIACP